MRRIHVLRTEITVRPCGGTVNNNQIDLSHNRYVHLYRHSMCTQRTQQSRSHRNYNFQYRIPSNLLHNDQFLVIEFFIL